MSRNWLFAPLFLTASVLSAAEAPKAHPDAAEDKELSGMSVLGNQEAPKALVLVPWKSSEIGASLGVSTMLDDSKQPVDKDVFMRALSYYEFRSNEKSDAQPTTAAHRRSS